MATGTAARAEQLERLWQDGWRVVGRQRRFVPGEGSPGARLMIVGEAPGAEEAARGKPFVGRSGQLLNRVLAEVGIAREQTWVTNLVKIRPTAEKGERIANRPPTADEMRAGQALLRREIDIIRPLVILCLGNLAARAIISKNFKMNTDHGKWCQRPDGIYATATFHPAYILRQSGPERDRLLGLFRHDLHAVRHMLDELNKP